MKNLLLLTILIILILPLSAVCSVDSITVNDTFPNIHPHQNGFLISRQFAELTAARFDSLVFYKEQTKRLSNMADNCELMLNKSADIINSHEHNANILKAQIITQSEIIKSYSKTDDINKNLQKSLKIETRKRKAWKVAAVTGLSLFATSVLYIYVYNRI
jgi:hypothetical protein